MSVSPTPNRSFLHGNRRTCSSSEKVVYATLDSLALKRTRLPLRLLPVDGSNVTQKTRKSKKEKDTGTELPSWQSNLKVNNTSLPSKYFKIITPSEAAKESSGNRTTMNGIYRDDVSTLCTVREDDVVDDIVDSSLHHEEGKAEINSVENDFYDTSVCLEEADVKEKIPKRNHVKSTSSSESGETNIPSVDGTDSNYYEKIELTREPQTVLKDLEKFKAELEEKISYSRKIFLKSRSTNDLAPRSSSDSGLNDREYSIETLAKDKLEEDLLLSNEDPVLKQKLHFAKNVLYFVPGHLAKRPKKYKKKKKTNSLSSSLSSLKPDSMDSEFTDYTNSSRSRSLSREKSKIVIISSPTNFVHVASATNPSLVSNENTVRSSLEQVVITHEQKCATLPLLIGREFEYCRNQNQKEQRLMKLSSDKSNVINKTDAIKYDSCGSRTMKQSAKVLERSQKVKTNENQANAEPGKTYERVCELTSTSPRVELRANMSFLWNNQTKNLLESKKQETSSFLLEDNNEDTWMDEYDDVEPLNLIDQEDYYDDVGSPGQICANEDRLVDTNKFSEDSEEIYDDIIAPNSRDHLSPMINFEENQYLIPRGNESIFERCRKTPSKTELDDSNLEEEHYLSISNEYSSVDEEDKNEIHDDEQGVYDDVGLPGEERVNSLYNGSVAGSILGLASTNGKESEWEDLEDPSTIGVPCPCRKNNIWKIAEPQIPTSSKKKVGQRWSRKVRRQRCRLPRKNSKSSLYVAVSLGGGSILLLGCIEKIEECRRKESADPTTLGDSQRTRGLVQMRVIDLDEDMDTQEASCYVHEDNASDDSNYESLNSFQPDDFSTDSETEYVDEKCRGKNTREKISIQNTSNYLEAPTRPNPLPPREASLTQTLGRRIKMLKRTWSITKGSLGRMRRRTSVDDDHCCEEAKDSCSDHQSNDGGKYFSFARHFRKSVAGLSTFYLEGNIANGRSDARNGDNCSSKEPIYNNTNWCRPVGNVHDSTSCLQKNTASEIRTSLEHYSVLADQEPLYQFYAAAAARVAFDSDSDNYEQVEDTIPSQATTDLAKPGQRTLWCQTPQILNSDLLQRLTVEEKKIQEAKFEILTSEASYLNSLRVLENEFLNDCTLNNDILTSSDRERLFGIIPNVLQASEKFLAELESVWRQDPMLRALPDVLLKYAEKSLDIYVAYCTNQVSIDATLKKLRARKGLKFLETVSQIETRPACQSLSLLSFLMLPMQRVTRLPLLADAVLSKLSMEHIDRARWEKVLSSLSYVVAECNEGARAAAKEAEIEALARKLEYSTKIKPVVLKGRHVVRSGPVVQLLTKADTEYKLTFGKKLNKTPLYLLLLTDYLLVTKFKSNTHDETYTVTDACKRSLIALEAVPEDSPFAGRNAMLLTLLENHSGHQVEYILTCDSDTERQRWLEAVSPSNRGLVGETLYEAWDCPQVVALYSYSPNQPDELSLQPGDVINVLRKMTDGWYHGEKLLDGEQGWFPGNYAKEVASEHVRARNLKQRHRLLALSGSVFQRKPKQQPAVS